MAYNSVTQKGNPVSDSLYAQYQRDHIEAQTRGEQGYRDYDHWYEEMNPKSKEEKQKNDRPNPR